MTGQLAAALLAASLAGPAAAAEPAAADIVARADEVRNPQLDYAVSVAVTDSRPEGGRDSADYEVLVKGRDRAVVKTLSPEINRGRTLLMRGRDMWVFLPDASQPVRITLQQRLMGGVANGDLARTNFSGDYAAKLLRREGKYLVLELLAKHDDLTYHRIVYWVEREGFRPAKAQFYALSGRLLKSCRYGGYREIGGGVRPTRLTIDDALVKGRVSTIEYKEMRVEPLGDKLFAKDYLKKLKY